MWKHLRAAVLFLVVMTVLTGFVYPLLITGIAQVAFNRQANGSLISVGGQTAGSDLIGQPSSDPKYFWGRLSATAPFAYNAASSSGANYGPSSPALTDAVKARLDALKAVDPGNDRPVPVDLVTFSASGLDPDISVAAALYQAPRIAHIRGLDEAAVVALVNSHVTRRQLGFLGEPRVNVLRLNLALDGLK